jgi:hypothetical protein
MSGGDTGPLNLTAGDVNGDGKPRGPVLPPGRRAPWNPSRCAGVPASLQVDDTFGYADLSTGVTLLSSNDLVSVFPP